MSLSEQTQEVNEYMEAYNGIIKNADELFEAASGNPDSSYAGLEPGDIINEFGFGLEWIGKDFKVLALNRTNGSENKYLNPLSKLEIILWKNAMKRFKFAIEEIVEYFEHQEKNIIRIEKEEKDANKEENNTNKME